MIFSFAPCDAWNRLSIILFTLSLRSVCPSVTAMDHKIFTYIIYHLLELIILLSYGLTLKSTPTNHVKLVTVDKYVTLQSLQMLDYALSVFNEELKLKETATNQPMLNAS